VSDAGLEPDPVPRAVDATLRRYLATALPISPRYPALRAGFRRVLEREILVKGPYVESLPDFEKGATLRDLLQAGLLHAHWSELDEDLLDRPLHRHQERAVRLALEERANFVVATGTGSGKTECFFFPIVDHLLRDPQKAAPGVRVLLIYPLNALANDQLYFRLAPLLLRNLKGTGITFGRFTSAIAANRKREEVERELLKNDELARVLDTDAAIDPSWLLTREEMLERPPHILITNYAMLEHLLLLPRNAPLFAEPRLQAIVLDEIHTYTGAQAIEVAYLLRKLRNRLQLPHPLQCIGTSASLGEGEDAESKTRRFVSDLFGTEVTEVVRGRRLRHRAFGDLPSTWQIEPAAWAALKEACRAFHEELPEDADDAARRELWAGLTLGVQGLGPLPENAASFGAAMLELFAANAEMRRASAALDQQMLRFDELAQQVFGPAPEAGEALAGLIAVGVLCRTSDKEFPLLPARYHLALSGIEGVSVRLDAEHPERWSDLAGKRSAGDAEDRYWPLLTCRNCGQPYIEAYANGPGLAPRPASTHAERRVLWLGDLDRLLRTDEAGSDEEEASDETATSERLSFDPSTGRFASPETGAAVTLATVDLERDEDEQRLYVAKRRCPACGHVERRFAEPIAAMRAGDEPLAAVAAQLLLEALPPPVAREQRLRPMDGRKLLVFSDNRQDAAFFAPNFERTSRDIALRTAICQVAARREGEPIGLNRLTDEVYEVLTADGARQGLFWDPTAREPLDRVRAKKELTGRNVAEFCGAAGRRISLESLGLVTVTYEARALKTLVDQLRRELPGPVAAQAEALALLLLENFRERRAISDVPGVASDDDSLWGVHAGRRSIEKSAERVGGGGTHWLPSPNALRGNKRTRLLHAVFGLDDEAARAVLETFWRWASHRQIGLIVNAGTFGGTVAACSTWTS
jgi:DEAD/DEAH box helicase